MRDSTPRRCFPSPITELNHELTNPSPVFCSMWCCGLSHSMAYMTTLPRLVFFSSPCGEESLLPGRWAPYDLGCFLGGQTQQSRLKEQAYFQGKTQPRVTLANICIWSRAAGSSLTDWLSGAQVTCHQQGHGVTLQKESRLGSKRKNVLLFPSTGLVSCVSGRWQPHAAGLLQLGDTTRALIPLSGRHSDHLA